MTEKQKLRIIKYKNKCKELGYEYIEVLIVNTNKKDLKAAETLLIDKKDCWSLNSIS